MKRLVLAFLVFGSLTASAMDCPVQFGNEDYIDQVSAKISAADSCEKGAQIAEACALGAGGDGAMVPVAERKCGLDFWKKLSAADKATYNKLQDKCVKKYSGMSGSMYVSFAAFCKLQVARLYSELYTPAE